MTHEARSLEPGARIRPQLRAGWGTNLPQRTGFVAGAVDSRAGYAGPRIVGVEGFRFTPWEVERAGDGEGG